MIRTSGYDLAHKEKKIQKLRCWLKKAKNNDTCNPQVIKEDDKILVLKTIIEHDEKVRP